MPGDGGRVNEIRRPLGFTNEAMVAKLAKERIFSSLKCRAALTAAKPRASRMRGCIE
jgi:hypothetical protein